MNRKITVIILLVVIYLQVYICLAQDNPFFSNTPADKEKKIDASAYPGFIQILLNGINNIQRDLNNNLSILSRKINQEKDFTVLFLLSGMALLYGLIHALGPGHGKIIMVSYALSNPLKVKQGLFLGVFVAIIHTLSAILLVSILYFLIKSTYSGYSQEPKRIISLISYGLITGMGVFLLIKIIFTNILKLKKNNDYLEIKSDEKNNKIQNLILPALIIGLVPCEGAVLILIFSISIDSFSLGIILAVAMSIGMALTISIIGITAIYSKKGVLKLIPKQTGTIKIISNIIQLVGAILILSFGFLLFISKL